MRIRSKEGGVFRAGLFLALFVLAATTLSWMLFLPYAATSSLKKATGYQTEIGTLVCNPFGFDLRAEDVVLQSLGSDPWLKLNKLEATASSPFAARQREFETLTIDADVIRLEVDEQRLFNLSKLTSGLRDLIGQQLGDIEVKEVTFRVNRFEIADYSGPVPKLQTLRTRFERGPYAAHSFMDIFQPLLEEAAKNGFRPLSAK